MAFDRIRLLSDVMGIPKGNLWSLGIARFLPEIDAYLEDAMSALLHGLGPPDDAFAVVELEIVGQLLQNQLGQMDADPLPGLELVIGLYGQFAAADMGNYSLIGFHTGAVEALYERHDSATLPEMCSVLFFYQCHRISSFCRVFAAGCKIPDSPDISHRPLIF